MRKLAVMVVLFATATFAMADTLLDNVDANSPTWAGSVNIGENAGQRGTVVYSNAGTVTSAYSRAATENAEIGDDLMLDTNLYPATGPGEFLAVDSLKWSVYNSSGSSYQMLTVGAIVRFYDLTNSTYLGGLNFGTLAPALDPGYYTTYSATGLAAFEIPAADEMLVTLQLSDPTWAGTGGTEKLGQVLTNPPSIGTSDDVFYRDGAWYWFSGSPVANFYWELDVAVVPEPATFALLALGLVCARRR